MFNGLMPGSKDPFMPNLLGLVPGIEMDVLGLVPEIDVLGLVPEIEMDVLGQVPGIDLTSTPLPTKKRAKKRSVDTSTMSPSELARYRERREKNTVAAKKARRQIKGKLIALSAQSRSLTDQQHALVIERNALASMRDVLVNEARKKFHK